MKKYPSYSVAIRTLGTAGDKFQETLNSVSRQIIKPESIYIYIPKGYNLPKETIGVEKYIRCEKGMVSQRSLPFDEITTDFILFLDDDVSFGSEFVKILFDGILLMEGDCISPDIYSVHNNSLLIKFRDYLGGTIPHWDKEYAFKIRKDGHYSYNNHPMKSVLLTQSGAGACMLCRKSAYQAIHFDDERWMDQFHFGLGEDQLFFYKLYKYGFTVLTSFDAEIIHLDAGSGHDKSREKNYISSGFCRYMIWYKTIYSYRNNYKWHLTCLFYFLLSQIRSLPLTIAMILKHHSMLPLSAYIKGVRIAKKFLKSDAYLQIPSYYEYMIKQNIE